MAQKEKIDHLLPGDESLIANMVGRLHVSQTDEDVAAWIQTKVKVKRCTPACAQRVVEVALAAHHANQDVFRYYRF